MILVHERLLGARAPRRQIQDRDSGGARNGGRQRERWRRCWKVSAMSIQTVLPLCTKVSMMNRSGGRNRTRFPQLVASSNNETSVSCSCPCPCPSESVSWTCVPCRPAAPTGLTCKCNPLSCMDSSAITGMTINHVGLLRIAEPYMKRCKSPTLSLRKGRVSKPEHDARLKAGGDQSFPHGPLRVYRPGL